MCRDYPRNLVESPVPQFLPDCTHCAVHRHAADVLESIDDLDLSPEKRQKIMEVFKIPDDSV